ncbi:MAG: hypothetical protein NUV84_03400, partial [Candidatus Uhrbacteria bacterium]|nr:hypothetical protein [Candidatus Uhrbacteria bacterium]
SRYQESGSLEDKTVFDDVLLKAKKAQENYREVAYAVVEYNGSSLIQIEVFVAERIENLCRHLKIGAFDRNNQGHVNWFSLTDSDASSLSINRVVALAVSYLPGLKALYCSNTLLSMLPETLPDSLEYINIQNTPAAKDLKVQEKLKVFKKAHPKLIVFL